MDPEEADSSQESSPDSPGDQQATKQASRKRGSKSAKPRLTAVQKNTNHKDAENKRRNAIRERFTELSNLVPEAQGQERSEQVVLTKTKAYLQESIEEIRQLEQMAEQRRIDLADTNKLKSNDFGGPDWKPSHFERYQADKVKKGGSRTDADADADADAEEDDEG